MLLAMETAEEAQSINIFFVLFYIGEITALVLRA